MLAEITNDDDQLLQIGHWAETVAGRLFPVMSFVVLGFGIGMTENLSIPYNQFWLIFGLTGWALSAATGILFLGPATKPLNEVAAEHGPESPEAQARLRRILLVARVDIALMFLDRVRHGREAVQLAAPALRAATDDFRCSTESQSGSEKASVRRSTTR